MFQKACVHIPTKEGYQMCDMISKRIMRCFMAGGIIVSMCISAYISPPDNNDGRSNLSKSSGVYNHAPVEEKPRLLVLTDIGGDPDDQQSMVRLCLYANEFNIEGLIASAAGTPGELKEKTVKPELIEEIVRAYGKVRNHLLQHHPDYPSAEYLLSKIKQGNPNRGLSYIGEDHNTEGSEWIIQVVDQKESGPVNVVVWGGQTDLAQALWKVKNTRSRQEYDSFISNLRIYDIADQDHIQSWMIHQFPGLFYILNKAPEGEDKRDAVFRGMYLGGDESLTSKEWINTHVRKNHGPLGALYPSKTWTAPNPHGVMKEGDTPSWFYFVPNGLSHPDHPQWGNWGGRFDSRGAYFKDAEDGVKDEKSARATVWRWRPDFQNDFQARMDWCVKSFQQANHNPVAAYNGDAGREIVYLTVSPDDEVSLSARGSSDPDGDSLAYHWWIYPEPSTKNSLSLSNDRAMVANFTAPKVSGQDTVHVILTVRDNGAPNLYSYRRIVIYIKEKMGSR